MYTPCILVQKLFPVFVEKEKKMIVFRLDYSLDYNTRQSTIQKI